MEAWKMAPQVAEDPILGLTKVCAQDPRPHKIELLAGVLKREGKVWLFDSVRQAQAQVAREQLHKGYLPMEGSPGFIEAISGLIGLPKDGWHGMQTLGATGALYLAGCTLQAMGVEQIWIPRPSWPNHRRLFETAGLKIAEYDYPLDLVKLRQLMGGRQRQVILLHVCCHNPSGLDLDEEQWTEVIDWISTSNHCLVLDMAYHGLKNGLESDAAPVRLAVAKGIPLMVGYSCAKNFTLYGERCGALFLNWNDPLYQARARSYLTHLARSLYSNPPLNGSAIVEAIFSSPLLKELWNSELAEAREHLRSKRRQLVEAFYRAGLESLGASIAGQVGMFAYFPLSSKSALWLRDKEAIYLPGEGRISLNSIQESHLDRLMAALSTAIHEGF